MMERQLRHMVRLIDDLMDVSRISRGKIELRKERIELAAVVQQCRRDQPPAHRGRCGHELIVDAAADSRSSGCRPDPAGPGAC